MIAPVNLNTSTANIQSYKPIANQPINQPQRVSQPQNPAPSEAPLKFAGINVDNSGKITGFKGTFLPNVYA